MMVLVTVMMVMMAVGRCSGKNNDDVSDYNGSDGGRQ